MYNIGHSFGLDIHEEPFLSNRFIHKLIKGNVIAIEPGIYLMALCGIRIEDDYLITDKSCECLSEKLTTNLITALSLFLWVGGRQSTIFNKLITSILFYLDTKTRIYY